MKYLGIIFLLLGVSVSLHGKTFKVGALVPEGTSWANGLKAMAKEIKKQTDGRVKIKLYLGGVGGDEPDVLRKIRIGQFHGGIFTGKALGDVYSDVRILEVPFNFIDDRVKAKKVMNGMNEYFDKGFKKNGFKNLGFFELGKVYIVSQKKAESLDGLKGIKVWAWEGDPLVKTMMERLELVSVPLALPDVLTSLSTGMIEAAYGPPLGVLAMQWQSKVKYVVDFPVTYSFGAFLLGDKAWKKIKPADQKIVQAVAKSFISGKRTDGKPNINDTTIAENKTSLDSLKSLGIKTLSFPKSELQKGLKIRKAVIRDMTDKLFSKQTVDLFEKSIH
tara:strand:- start:233 stop:1228 length:996 start_codon:yes stop_codon:yes gene_type:complete